MRCCGRCRLSHCIEEGSSGFTQFRADYNNFRHNVFNYNGVQASFLSIAAKQSSRLCARGLRTMASPSIIEEKHEWNAPRVRETFLEYFKKNGHTFGGYSSFLHLYSI